MNDKTHDNAKQGERSERLNTALRDNLKRRKAAPKPGLHRGKKPQPR